MKKTVSLMFAAATLVSGIALAMSDSASVANAAPRNIPAELRLSPTDIYLGEKDAPVQIVEYASMTCGHCADFHKETFKKVKESFVDTGKVRFTLRELPWDNMSLAVSKIARCAPKDQYYNFVDAFFATRENWIHAEKPLVAIKKTARLGGMTPEAVDECLASEEIQKIVLDNKNTALEKLNVQGTPTLFINGEQVEGTLSFQSISFKISEALGE